MRINNYFIFIILLTNSLFSQELTIKGKIHENSTTDKDEVFKVSKNIFGVNPQKLYEFVMDEENKNIIPENIKKWKCYIKKYSNK